VHESAPNNIAFDWEIGNPKAEVDEAIANSHHVTSLEFVNQRMVPNPIEPRSAIGLYEPSSDRYTLYTSTQNPHLIRLLMCAFVLGIPEHKVRVVGPDVGGGFGSKIFHYTEEALVTWCSKQIERPVKWTSERSEAFITDAHGRDHVTHAEMGFDKMEMLQRFVSKHLRTLVLIFRPCSCCTNLFAWYSFARFVHHSKNSFGYDLCLYAYQCCRCLPWCGSSRSYLFVGASHGFGSTRNGGRSSGTTFEKLYSSI
jgi:hypothetical protein